MDASSNGCGFALIESGNGEYLYQDGNRKEKISEEKIKKIKRRIVDKIHKATPVETLQFAYNNQLICDQLFS